MKIPSYFNTVRSTVPVIAVCASATLLALAVTMLVMGSDETESGKTPSANWDEHGNRREDPPTPAVPASAYGTVLSGQNTLLAEAGRLGLSPDVVRQLLMALANGDPEATIRLFDWNTEPCVVGVRGGDAPRCLAGVEPSTLVKFVGSAGPGDGSARLEAEVRQALELTLGGNAAALVLAAKQDDNTLFVSFEFAARRTLPGSLGFGTKGQFISFMLIASETPISALAIGDGNPLSAFWRFMDPDLSGLIFVGDGPLALEHEAEMRAREAEPGPIPTVSR